MRPRDGTRALKQDPVTLTPRQEEVMRLLKRGLTNGEIAEALGITLDGAKFHVAEIISKLGASSREEAVEVWSSRPRSRWTVPGIAWLKFAGGSVAALAGIGVIGVFAAAVRSGTGDSDGGPALPPAVLAGEETRPTGLGPDGLVACPTFVPTTPQPNTVVDWIDFVNFGGVHYLGNFDGPGTRVPASALGDPYGRVQVNVSETAVDAMVARADCEAAFLPVGEVLYRVNGYEPRFRIATKDGKVYQAYSKPTARTAGEFIDIHGKVGSVVVRDFEDNRQLARITDQAAIDTLTSELESGQFDDSASGDASPRYRIAFQLRDGTTWTSTFSPSESKLWPGISVSDAFTRTILEAVNP